MPHTDLHELTVTQALAKMASGVIRARDLTEAVIARCEAARSLNAFVSHDWDKLRQAADAVDASGKAGQGLGGVPLCIKDNIATGLFPAGAATGALAKVAPGKPSPVVEALVNAGALVGATGNMHELAFGITTNNATTGAAHNPWNEALIPGGSSGGVAAAVAARLMPAGIGTDTGASVRLPAALCGIVGYRPTVGRYSNERIVPISHTRDTAGPMTQTVEDARLLDSVLTGRSVSEETVSLAGLRLGVPRDYFYDPLEPAVAKGAEAALEALRKAGVELVEAGLPDVAKFNEPVSFTVALYEFLVDLQKYLDDNDIALTLRDVCNGTASPDVRGLFEGLLGDAAVPEAVYREAMTNYRPQLQAIYRDYFAKHDVVAVIFPTTPMTARPIGQDETVEFNGEQVPAFGGFIRNVDPGSNAAIPGISLPVGLSDEGLPIGIEIDGPAGSDERLLAVAAAIEPVFAFDGKPRLS